MTLETLRMTLKRRKLAAGLVHHSDRGVQYAFRDYTDLLPPGLPRAARRRPVD